MHDVQGFHEALSGLTPRGRIALDYRCQGHSLSVVAEDQGVNMEAIRSRMTVVFRRLRRRTRSLAGVREQGITEAACYHLGYEQALADIEALVALAAGGRSLAGAITGRAVYEGAFTVAQAVAVTRGSAT